MDFLEIKQTKPRKRRKYSRNGCNECKRRKLKCDEEKPYCTTCIQGGKVCSYEKKLKFTTERSFTIKNHKDGKAILTNFTTSKSKPIKSKKNDQLETKAATLKLPFLHPNIDPFVGTPPLVVKNEKKPSLNLDNVPINVHNDIDIVSNDIQFHAPASSLSLSSLLQQPQSQQPVHNKIDLENSLFDEATNLISDLNDFFASFDVEGLDFLIPNSKSLNSSTALTDNKEISNIDVGKDIVKECDNILSNKRRQSIHISDFKIEGISPTNYSVSGSEHANSPLNLPSDSIFSYKGEIDLQNNVSKPPQSSNRRYPQLYTKSSADTPMSSKSSSNSSDSDDAFDNEDDSEEDKTNDDDDDNDDDNNNYIHALTKSLTVYNKSITGGYIDDKMTNSEPAKIKQSTSEILRSVGLRAYPCPPKLASGTIDIEEFDYLKLLDSTLTDKTMESLAKFFNWPLESTHLKYLKIFFTNIHLNFLPFSTSYINNAYVNTFLRQARSSPHLLFAILAIASRYEAYQIEQKLIELGVKINNSDETRSCSTNTNTQKSGETTPVFESTIDLEQNTTITEHKSRLAYHLKFRTHYLSSCLRALSSILDNKQKTLNNIDSLLLTILVLASDSSGLRGSQWRAHLHGAKDLLVKYVKLGIMDDKKNIMAGNNNSNKGNEKLCSIELTIVWLWFYSMEILAALTAPQGGTIHEINDLQDFLPVLLSTNEDNRISLASKEFGFSIPCENGRLFNMYLGFDESMINAINLLVLGIECSRKYKEIIEIVKNSDSKVLSMEAKIDHYMNLQLSREENYKMKQIISSASFKRCDRFCLSSDFFIEMFSHIQKAREFKYISNKAPYLIPTDHLLHPQNIKNNPIDLITSTYIKDNNNQFYSFIDLSQQLYADAICLKLMTMRTKFSITDEIIQDIVERMIYGLKGIISWRKHFSENDEKLIERYGASPIEINEEIKINSNSGWPTFPFNDYLIYALDRRSIMIQWPLYVLGLFCITAKQKVIVECCFDGMIKLGVGSGEISLRKLQRIWRRERKGNFDYERDCWSLFGDLSLLNRNAKEGSDGDEGYIDSVPFT